MSRAYNALGDYVTSATFSRRNVELLDRVDVGLHYFNMRVLSRCALASSLAELGQFVEAIACADEGGRMADGTERAFPIIAARLASGSVRLLKGELEPARSS